MKNLGNDLPSLLEAFFKEKATLEMPIGMSHGGHATRDCHITARSMAADRLLRWGKDRDQDRALSHDLG